MSIRYISTGDAHCIDCRDTPASDIKYHLDALIDHLIDDHGEKVEDIWLLDLCGRRLR